MLLFLGCRDRSLTNFYRDAQCQQLSFFRIVSKLEVGN